MRRKWIAALLALALLISVIPAFSFRAYSEEDAPEEPGEEEALFTDIENHWGRPYIERAVAMGLFSGTSAATFSPDAPMTRAMFVTVLAKLASIDGSAWQKDYMTYIFSDLNAGSYYVPYVAWAVHGGFTSGTGSGSFSPNGKVTREQIATFLASYLRIENVTLQTEGTVEAVFSDEAGISAWAKDSVGYLAGAGIFRGMSDGNGGFLFNPKKPATRAECATIFCQLVDSILPDETPRSEPAPK